MAILKNTLIDDTFGINLPSTSTDERPLNPIENEIRYNSTLNIVEQYRGIQWYYIPDIIRDNLVVHLDAGEPSSYIGAGSAWNDISGNENNFSLFNNPSFENGSIQFNGSSQYAKTISLLDLSSSAAVTVEVLAKTIVTTSSSLLWEHTEDWNQNIGGMGQSAHSDGGQNEINTHHTNHRSFSSRNYKSAVNSEWAMHTNVFSTTSDNTGRAAYVNGRFVNFSNGNNLSLNSSVFTSADMFLAARGGTQTFLNGNIAIFRVYNRKLTSAEILQNFQVNRKRFNI